MYENYDQGTGGKRKLDEKTLTELLGVFDSLDIYSWDGYNESNDEMLDGMGFSLFVQMADGTSITASGDNCFPENFQEFEQVILSMMN